MNTLNNLVMRKVRPQFECLPAIDAVGAFEAEWNRVVSGFSRLAPSRVAVCVGSREVSNMVPVARAVVAKLKSIGHEPFITPAMGSHGGACAEGQIKVLERLGVTEQSIGAPVMATMEVVEAGEVDGIPLLFDRLAWEADGIVVINRIKEHTDFSGPTQSGIIKMMAIGLGNQAGANLYHGLGLTGNLYQVISTAGLELSRRAPFWFGVGLVENQLHETVRLSILTADMLPHEEAKLLNDAKKGLPRLPLTDVDLLIVDEIGKNVSGGGMDPKVTGRNPVVGCENDSDIRISRIFVRDLTDESEGNAIGIGQADFTTDRLVKKTDLAATAMNCVTCALPECAKMPIAYPTDREAIYTALTTIRPHTQSDLRLVRIRNTSDLDTFFVSTGCLPVLQATPFVTIEPDPMGLEFDSTGNLLNWYTPRHTHN